nr:2-amino-4-hydroxy-6-hydroxymethyldihydropteridine diphosphokinase [Muribaculaceae bacterium]
MTFIPCSSTDITRTNEAIICMGANSPDAAAQLRRAFALLATLGTVCRCTRPYPTAPEKVQTVHPYTNQIIVLRTPMTHAALLAACKTYETHHRHHAPADTVAIDIDIVVFNGAILRPSDYAATYFRQGLAT